MHYLLRVLVLSTLVALNTSYKPATAKPQAESTYIHTLEKALNYKEKNTFNEIFSPQISNQIQYDYERFLNRFPNAQWKIEPSTENENILKVVINGTYNKEGQQYQIEAGQTILIKKEKEKIINHLVLNEYSILNSSKQRINVILSIPNKVLTGTKYNADIIIEEPLEDSIIAGNLIHIDQGVLASKTDPEINLSPLTSGGIFKIIQAPLTPGTQTLIALIAHPEGLIAITKKVRIVSEYSSDIN